MKSNIIRSIFGLGKKSKKQSMADFTYPQMHSPTSSISSFTSETTDEDTSPNTPTSAAMHDNRGIFRTLEPIWFYRSSLDMSAMNTQQSDWSRFDDFTQTILERSFMKSDDKCFLEQTSFGAITVVLKNSTMESKKRSKKRLSEPFLSKMEVEHSSSTPTLNTRTSAPSTTGVKLYMNTDIRRIISPVWWYEQDSIDGTKGMCRFDHKNQARLEALSEGRTKLVLHDDGLQIPFTVVLDAPKSSQLKEEVRGFLYFNSAPPSPRQFNDCYDQINVYQQQFGCYEQDFDSDLNLDNIRSRRFSI
ncbi:hypothetical protein K501DRAFT_283257 [Backusella circina FSU 941]|nr:hypothetical protein K501DRAFT_283257 [Backusella circina FSU 941]